MSVYDKAALFGQIKQPLFFNQLNVSMHESSYSS